MNGASGPYVVVGIDASPSAEQALDWAADDAAARGARLRIGYSWSAAAYRLPEGDRRETADAARSAAEDLVNEAAQRARDRCPGLDVTTELLPDEPVVSLIDMSDRAELLVVGSRGLNRFAALLLGSVGQALAAHAPCPVVVVRTADKEGGVPTTGVVVLGVAPREEPGPLEFAFTEAQRRGVPLRAVRTWMSPQALPGHVVVPPQEEAERSRQEAEELEALLAVVRKSFPEVPVVTEVVLAEPEAALVDASRNGCLVVVGTRRRRGRFALPLGRVAHRALQHAYCPVAVVPV